ncbi:MobC family plasmid mobilization relaxosome protein, partial [Aeromonas caviae]|uniref:MobC family plasmid mobilization relaxosome protein n=1 Tax=Aeromonas caviae TaxID=648 RepID=UPI0022A7FEC7
MGCAAAGEQPPSSARASTPPTIDPALLRQVAGIGNNLNQIARRINASPLTTLDKV